MLQIRPPYVAIGAEVSVAAVTRSDHIQPQRQGFRSVQGEPLSWPQGLGPAEMTWATDAGDTHDLPRPHDLQP